MNEPLESNERYYPPKPGLELLEKNKWLPLISMLLFVVGFAVFYKWKLSYIAMVTGVILIHELGHALAMKIFNYSDVSILFIPFLGGLASGNKHEISQKQESIILLAGPVPGILIGILLRFLPANETIDLNGLSNTFIFLNVFNLLPIYPLDGGRLLKLLFFEKNDVISKVFLFISMGFLVFVAISTKSYALLIIPFFLTMQITAQIQSGKLKKSLTEKGIQIRQSYDDLSDKDYWRIRDEIAIHISSFARFISPGVYEVSERETQVIKYIQTLLRKPAASDVSPFNLLWITMIWIISFALPLVLLALVYLKNNPL